MRYLDFCFTIISILTEYLIITTIMTNEEKSLELSSINKYGFSVEESNAAYNAAHEMAQWKQQQLIDKAVEFFYDQLNNTNNFDCNIEEFINKFKQIMEE